MFLNDWIYIWWLDRRSRWRIWYNMILFKWCSSCSIIVPLIVLIQKISLLCTNSFKLFVFVFTNYTVTSFAIYWTWYMVLLPKFRNITIIYCWIIIPNAFCGFLKVSTGIHTSMAENTTLGWFLTLRKVSILVNLCCERLYIWSFENYLGFIYLILFLMKNFSELRSILKLFIWHLKNFCILRWQFIKWLLFFILLIHKF